MKMIYQIYFKKEIGEEKVNIITLQPYSLITKKEKEVVEIKNNKFQFNKNKDILKLAVIERHKNTGNIGIGLVKILNYIMELLLPVYLMIHINI